MKGSLVIRGEFVKKGCVSSTPTLEHRDREVVGGRVLLNGRPWEDDVAAAAEVYSLGKVTSSYRELGLAMRGRKLQYPTK